LRIERRQSREFVIRVSDFVIAALRASLSTERLACRCPQPYCLDEIAAFHATPFLCRALCAAAKAAG
jgi:hypothetical protein